MNDYTGKFCPYCKTAFQPGDDIIVCSACDMPHHKDCWIENQGCTTFGCRGTIKAVDHGYSSVTATQMHFEDFGSTASPAGSGVFCTQCGTQSASTASFCARCGSRLATVPNRTPEPPANTPATPNNSDPYFYTNPQYTPYQAQNNDFHSGYDAYQSYQASRIDPDVQLLVGEKAEYYIPKFQQIKWQDKPASWNWPAFLVTPYWLMYRKMYGCGFLFLAADLLLSLMDFGFFSLLALGGYIVFGILGNSIYMKFLEKKASTFKAMTEPYKTQALVKNSGVNMLIPILACIGRIILVGIFLW